VRESDDGVDTPLLPGDLGLEAFHDRLADAVHAANVGNDPDLVTHAHLSVRAAEALEGPRCPIKSGMTLVIAGLTGNL
jgi:hypothetical protein